MALGSHSTSYPGKCVIQIYNHHIKGTRSTFYWIFRGVVVRDTCHDKPLVTADNRQVPLFHKITCISFILKSKATDAGTGISRLEWWAIRFPRPRWQHLSTDRRPPCGLLRSSSLSLSFSHGATYRDRLVEKIHSFLIVQAGWKRRSDTPLLS